MVKYCTDPQKLDLKSNDWRSVFLCPNIAMNSKRKLLCPILMAKVVTHIWQTFIIFHQKTRIREWVAAYQKFGDEGLFRSRQQAKYSFEKKLSVVESYLSSEISYQDLALQEGITNPCMIVNWVNRFRAAGPEALRPRKKGRKKTVDKPKTDSKVQETEERIVDTGAEYVKELEDETS